jgi:hypothetical protein
MIAASIRSIKGSRSRVPCIQGHLCTRFISTAMNNAFADGESSPFFLSSLRRAYVCFRVTS